MVLTIVLGALTLGGIAFAIYRTFDEPNKKQDKEIAVDNAVCSERHKGIDDHLRRIDDTLLLIKDNDLRHIEQRMNTLAENQVKIFTILEERLSKKI